MILSLGNRNPLSHAAQWDAHAERNLERARIFFLKQNVCFVLELFQMLEKMKKIITRLKNAASSLLEEPENVLFGK